MRATRRIFVAVLCVLLVLPPLQMVLRSSGSGSLNEKRPRFEIPQFLPRLQGGDPTLHADVNRWFDDRMGFRDTLIRLRNQIDYSVFGTSRRLALGREGWLFLRDHDEALVVYERGGDAWRRAISDKLIATGRHLRERGIRFIVLAIPDKGDVETGFRGRESPVRPAVTQFDKLRDELSGSPDLIYLDARDIWRRDGTTGPAYWRTDIHHDQPAAHRVALALVRKIAELEGVPVPLETRAFVEQTETFTGDLVPFLGKWFPVRETISTYRNRFNVGEDSDEGRWEQETRALPVPGRGSMPPFDFIYKSSPGTSAAKLPVTVLFGNSFADMYFAAGIQTYFKAFYRARNVMPRFNVSIAHLPEGTRYLVFQFFAPFVGAEMQEWTPDFREAGAAR